MQLIEIQSRAIYILFEFSIKQLEKLKLSLEITELNPKTEEEKEAANYLTMVVYPLIKKTIDDLKGTDNA